MNSMHLQRKLLFAAVAVGIIAPFLSWFRMGALGYGVSQNGFDYEGGWFFFFALVAGVLVFIGDKSRHIVGNQRIALMVIGVFALVPLFGSYSTVSNRTSGLIDLSLGVGFFMAALAALAFILLPILLKPQGDQFTAEVQVLSQKAQKSIEKLNRKQQNPGNGIPPTDRQDNGT